MPEYLSSRYALPILQNCQLPLLVQDKQGRVLGYNLAFEHLVGQPQAVKLQGQLLAELGNHPLYSLLGGDSPLRWEGPHAITHHFEIQTIELPDADHVQARLFIDISRQVTLEQQVLTDDQTGLLNERGIMLALEPQVARSRRYNSTMSVVVLDAHCPADSSHAHPYIARLLKDQLRWADLIGCSEDKGFMLVLPETNTESCLQLVEKLRRLLDELADTTLNGQAISTIVGVAGWRRNDSAANLISRARVALAQARAEKSDLPVAL